MSCASSWLFTKVKKKNCKFKSSHTSHIIKKDGVVVEQLIQALRYKAEVRGFDSPCGQ